MNTYRTVIPSFRTLCLAGALGISLYLAPCVRADTSKLFQEALMAEEALQDLEGAIKGYQAVIESTESAMRFASSALYRIGECHRKLGNTNEAIASFRRVIELHPQQTNLVRLSQQNLAALNALLPEPAFGGGAGMGGAGGAMGPGSVSAFGGGLGSGGGSMEASGPGGSAGAAGGTDPGLGSGSAISDSGRQMLAEVARLEAQLKHLTALNSHEQAKLVGRIFPDPIIERFNQDIYEAQTSLFRLNQELGGDHPQVRNGQEQLHRLEIGLIEHTYQVLDTQKNYARLLRATAEAELESLNTLNVAQARGITAEEAQQLEHVETLIRNSPDRLNRSINGGDPILHAAAHSGHLIIMRRLLDSGQIDINSHAPNGGATPLHLAARQGHKAMVDLLLEHGAKVDARRARLASGSTPLNEAAQNGYTQVVQRLVDAGADVNSKAGTSMVQLSQANPLHLAASHGHLETVKLLIKAGAEVDALAEYDYALPWEVHQHDGLQRMQPYKKFSATFTPLMLAVKESHSAVVDALLAAGANVDGSPESIMTPLSIACQWDRTPEHTLIQKLIRAGANPNPIHAVQLASVREVPSNETLTLYNQILCQSPIHILIMRCALQENAVSEFSLPEIINRRTVIIPHIQVLRILQSLFAAGASPNIVLPNATVRPDYRGNWITFIPLRTPLGLAAQLGNTGVVNALLEAGADPALEPDNMALWIAVRNYINYTFQSGAKADPALADSAWMLVESLLRAGASFDNIGSSQNLAIFNWAAAMGDVRAVKAFVAHGAKPGTPDNPGTSQLFAAACRGNRLAIINEPHQEPLRSYFMQHPVRPSQPVMVQEGGVLLFPSEPIIRGNAAYLEVIDILIKAGADVHQAVPLGKEYQLGNSTLLSDGAQSTAPAENQSESPSTITPLAAAQEIGFIAAAEKLIAAGAKR